MAQTETTKLDAGDRFPKMTLKMIDAETPLRLPSDLSAEYTIFLGYRGKW